MYRLKAGKHASRIASQLAEKHKLYYGPTVFGGDYFVGTLEELNKVGVPVPFPCLSIQLENDKIKK